MKGGGLIQMEIHSRLRGMEVVGHRWVGRTTKPSCFEDRHLFPEDSAAAWSLLFSMIDCFEEIVTYLLTMIVVMIWEKL